MLWPWGAGAAFIPNHCQRPEVDGTRTQKPGATCQPLVSTCRELLRDAASHTRGLPRSLQRPLQELVSTRHPPKAAPQLCG